MSSTPTRGCGQTAILPPTGGGVPCAVLQYGRMESGAPATTLVSLCITHARGRRRRWRGRPQRSGRLSSPGLLLTRTASRCGCTEGQRTGPRPTDAPLCWILGTTSSRFGTRSSAGQSTLSWRASTLGCYQRCAPTTAGHGSPYRLPAGRSHLVGAPLRVGRLAARRLLLGLARL